MEAKAQAWQAKAGMLGMSQEWQPIETAPKDAPILIWDRDLVQPLIVGWYKDYQGLGYWGVVLSDQEPAAPSHWMPLPEAPE